MSDDHRIIHVRQFTNGTQGELVDRGTLYRAIEQLRITRTVSAGCCSPELQPATVPVATVAGRRWVLNARGPKGALAVTLPSGIDVSTLPAWGPPVAGD